MKEIKSESFLPKGEIVIGVTSGASTPDAYMEKVRWGRCFSSFPRDTRTCGLARLDVPHLNDKADAHA